MEENKKVPDFYLVEKEEGKEANMSHEKYASELVQSITDCIMEAGIL